MKREPLGVHKILPKISALDGRYISEEMLKSNRVYENK